MPPLSTKLLLPPELLQAELLERDLLRQNPDATTDAISLPTVVCWVALSGGMDSCVLLHLLKNLPLNSELRALHINHQISPNANQWQDFCADLCRDYQIPFFSEKVQIKNNGRGLEDAAREERYRIFERYLEPNHVLFMAHHADDQVETFLLRLMRGAGPKGLSGIAYARTLGAGKLYRPMLSIPRADIAVYARENQLSWVEDESNQNDRYNRNYLRNQVLPLLQVRWPEYQTKVQQTANLCAQTDALMNDLAELDFAALDEHDERIGKSISLTQLKMLSQARRQNLLRFWMEKNAWDTPEINHFNQIESQLIFGRLDAEAQVNFGDVSLRVFRQRLFALPLHKLPIASEINKAIDINIGLAQLNLSPQMSLCLTRHAEPSAQSACATRQAFLKSSLNDLNVRFRQGGERAQPQGRAHSQTLKNLFQEYQLEPWLRHIWPLIYSGDQLVAVPGLWVCQGFVAEREPGIHFDVTFSEGLLHQSSKQ